jgi:hypothetical protein
MSLLSKYECKPCNYSCNNAAALYKHRSTKHPDGVAAKKGKAVKNFKCVICDGPFSTNQKLKQHQAKCSSPKAEIS